MAIKGCAVTFSLGSNVVAELNNVALNNSADSLDITTFDSSCKREFLAGLRSATIDISGFYDPSDTNGQVAMWTAYDAGALLTTTQKPKILWDGTNGFEGDAYITSYNIDVAVDGVVNFSATLQVTGALTLLP